MPSTLAKKSLAHASKYPRYGSHGRWFLGMFYFIPGMPWIPKATPDVYPHIAHFVTAPEHMGKAMLVKSSPKQKTYSATYIKHQP